MSSREKILLTIKNNLPKETALPAMKFDTHFENRIEKFKTVLQGIGGTVLDVNSWEEIKEYIENTFKDTDRIISSISELDHEKNSFHSDPHQLETVKLAILPGHFAVAESGAVWITESCMSDRALPFITEHLALVVSRNEIVDTLHDAYERMDNNYNLGTFIAGPSKTADIEQSLVLGAHGAKSLVVFLI